MGEAVAGSKKKRRKGKREKTAEADSNPACPTPSTPMPSKAVGAWELPWELGPQRALLWEGKSRCDVTAGSSSQPRIHGSFSVSACCGWLQDSRDGVMQRDEALLFPLGVAQTVGRGQAASPIQLQPPLHPCPGRCSSQRAGFITSPDEMGFPNKRALTLFFQHDVGSGQQSEWPQFFRRLQFQSVVVLD